MYDGWAGLVYEVGISVLLLAVIKLKIFQLRRRVIFLNELSIFISQFCFFRLSVFSPNSFSYRGSYFKLGGEGSQVLWIRCGGGCHTGSRWRCRLVCVGVKVRRSKTRRHTGCGWRCNLLMCVGVRGLQI